MARLVAVLSLIMTISVRMSLRVSVCGASRNSSRPEPLTASPGWRVILSSQCALPARTCSIASNRMVSLMTEAVCTTASGSRHDRLAGIQLGRVEGDFAVVGVGELRAAVLPAQRPRLPTLAAGSATAAVPAPHSELRPPPRPTARPAKPRKLSSSAWYIRAGMPGTGLCSRICHRRAPAGRLSGTPKARGGKIFR